MCAYFLAAGGGWAVAYAQCVFNVSYGQVRLRGVDSGLVVCVA